MEFGLQVSGSWDDVVAAARWAESEGLAALAMPDHYVMSLKPEGADAPAADALAQLAGLAVSTSSIQLVSLVSPVTFRHPAVMLKMAVTIDVMSRGRFSMGVGTGWLDLEHELFGFEYPEMSVRYDMMEEALAYMRAGLADEPTAFEGEHYRVHAFDMNPKPVGKVPLIVGGTGAKKTPRLAGRYADEFNSYPGKGFADRVSRARHAAVEAGRDPDALMISSAGQVLIDETQAGYDERFNKRAADAGMTAEELTQAYERRNTPRGTVEQVAEQLADFKAAGVQRFYYQAGNASDFEEIQRTLGLLKQVL